MKIRLRTVISTDVEVFWSKLKDPVSLQFVAKPLITFECIEQVTQGADWKEGMSYKLPVRYFGRIPAGVQPVTMVAVEEDSCRIITNESGGVARQWHHTMQLKKLHGHSVEYRDTLEIEAGYKTPFLWLFVHVFYRHRQQRWKKLLRNL